jgi:nucleoside triphosphate pyrophosphatase
VTLVLASTSLRRYQILALLGLPFLMVPPACREVLSGARPPAQEALHQARQKAASLLSRFPDAVILGSDTLINLDGRLIGKPGSADDARAILQRLRGRSHDVVTGVCFLESPPPFPSPLEGEGATRHPSPLEGEGGGEGASGERFEHVETARVTMRDFTDAELDAYLATGDPLDKAGSYAIQGAGRDLVASLDGDYLAVVGLPLRAVARGLAKLGCPVTVDVDCLYRERGFLNWRTFPSP